MIRIVIGRHVERHARRAADQLGDADPAAVVSVTRDPDNPHAVLVQLSSADTAPACESALRTAGYAVQQLPSATLRVEAPRPPEPEHTGRIYIDTGWHTFQAHRDDQTGSQCRWCFGWYDDPRHHTEQPHPRGNQVVTIVCNGRAQTLDAGVVELVGEPCGRKLYAEPRLLADKATAAGWKVGPAGPDGQRNVMCDRCGKADATIPRTLQGVR